MRTKILSRPPTCTFSSMSDSEVAHIQAVFFSKNKRYTTHDVPFSLPVSASRDDLSHLINQLLETDDTKVKEFDFLISGALVRNQLGKTIEQLNVNTENVVEIEYVERSPPPVLDQQFNHNDWLSAVHCNREYVLTGCYDNSVQIWNYKGELVSSSSAHKGPISGVSWLPNKCSNGHLHFVSSSQDQTLNLWKFNCHSHKITLLHVCKGHAEPVYAIAIDPKGSKVCSVGWDKHVKIWNASADESEELSDSSEESEVASRAKRPKLDHSLQPVTRTPLMTLAGHTHPITTASWPKEEEFLTAGYDHCIRVWDTATGINKNTLTGSKVFLNIHTQQEGGHLIASGNTDRHVRIWDPRSNDVAVTSLLSSHHGWVKCVQWSPAVEHQLASGCYDKTVKLWDIRSSKTPLYTITAHEDKLLCMDWSLSGVLATGGADNYLRTFSFE